MIKFLMQIILKKADFQSFTVRRSYASADLGVVIQSVCPSLRLSVIRVLFDKTRQCTADIWQRTKGQLL